MSRSFGTTANATSDYSRKRSSAISNRHSSYIPSTEPLDVLSLLTPSAKTKFSSDHTTSSDVPPPARRRSSNTKVVYSIKSSDGSDIKPNDPIKRSVFGKSGIYGALEAALSLEENERKTTPPRPMPANESPPTAAEDEEPIRRLPKRLNSDSHIVLRKTPSSPPSTERNAASLDVETAFPSLRARIQSLERAGVRSSVTRRSLPPTPEKNHLVRRVSYGSAERPENVSLKKYDSEDSGCDESFEESLQGSAHKPSRVASVTSLDSVLASPRISATGSPEFLKKTFSSLAEEEPLEERACSMPVERSSPSGSHTEENHSLQPAEEKRPSVTQRVAGATPPVEERPTKGPKEAVNIVLNVSIGAGATATKMEEKRKIIPESTQRQVEESPPEKVHASKQDSFEFVTVEAPVFRENSEPEEEIVTEIKQEEAPVERDIADETIFFTISPKKAPKEDILTPKKTVPVNEPKKTSPVTIKKKKKSSKSEKSAASKPEKIATSKPEKTATSKPEKIAISKPEKVATSKPEKVATSKPEKIAISKPEKVATSKPEKVATSKPEKTAISKPEKIAISKPEKVATSKPEKTATSKPEKTATSTPEAASTVDRPLCSTPEIVLSSPELVLSSPELNLTSPEVALSSTPDKPLTSTPEKPLSSTPEENSHPRSRLPLMSEEEEGPGPSGVQLSPVIARLITEGSTSPVSSSDESDAEWRAKILASRNLMRSSALPAPQTGAQLRPDVSTILEGCSEEDEEEEGVLAELPVFKPIISRHFSKPITPSTPEHTSPLAPGRRRKSKTSQVRRKSSTAPPKPKVDTGPRPVSLDLDFASLDAFVPHAGLQSPLRKNTRPIRRTTTSQNPVKLRQELEKQRNADVKAQEEKELAEAKVKDAKGPRTNAGAHWQKALMATSAINGLRKTIDFSAAKTMLRKTEKNADGTAKVSKAAGEESMVEPKFPEKLLLMLKGRKNVQCCLVECKVSSLNSGDIFILAHRAELFLFVGMHANVHEKAKGNDLVDRIVRRKEMGCTAAKCTVLQEKDMDMGRREFKRFFQLLEGRPPIAEQESAIEDREFERRFQSEVRVSVFTEEEGETPARFVQLDTGKRLRYEILDSKKTFVLDFITEYYVWCGKGVPMSVRKKALNLAEENYKKTAWDPANPTPQARRTSVVMAGGTTPEVPRRRRSSCVRPASTQLPRRTSSDTPDTGLTQRSNSTECVSGGARRVSSSGRRVSLSVNSGSVNVSASRVSSTDSLARRPSTSSRTRRSSSITSVSSSTGVQSGGSGRRSSVVLASSGRRNSLAGSRGSLTGTRSRTSTCSTESLPGSTRPAGGRRVSVSTKQLRSLVSGSGRRIQTDDGDLQVERPEWGINTGIIEGKEPICLREKFVDWPEPGRIIKMKGHPASGEEKGCIVAPMAELVPYDATLMHRPQPTEEILRLEGSKLGRGRGTTVTMNGEKITVHTDDVKVWLVHDYRVHDLPPSYHHIFYSDEGYVIRWEYHLVEDDGFVAKNKAKRCAYYFWQGCDLIVNQKGATALKTIELDKEKASQIRVVQHREPPSLLNLFKGGLVIRSDSRAVLDRDQPNLGRRDYPAGRGGAEMFIVRGECVEEVHLLQVPARMSSLRSRACFVVVAPNRTVYLWMGSKVPPHGRECAEHAASRVGTNYNGAPPKLVTVEEMSEPAELTRCLGSPAEYGSLIKSEDSHVYTPRLFRFHTTTGRFIAEEVLCKYRVPGRDTQFPFIQDDLYEVGQPALFLLDAKYQLWFWQGWFEVAAEGEKVTGSARLQFGQNKKLAMETVKQYVEELMLAVDPKVYPIDAGHEPLDFTSLFPFWEEREDVKRFSQEKATTPAVTSGRRTSINTAYQLLTRTEYSLEELRQKPEGVDPAKLEDYLSEEEFRKVFGMHRKEFKELPEWKRNDFKILHKLY